MVHHLLAVMPALVNCLYLELILNGILTILVAAVGLFGNVMVLIIQSSMKTLTSTAILLIALSVTDTLYLLTEVILRTINSFCVVAFHISHQVNPFCDAYIAMGGLLNYILYPLSLMFVTMSAYFVMNLTITRFIIIRFPFKAKMYASKSVALFMTGTTILLCVTLVIPQFFSKVVGWEQPLEGDLRDVEGWDVNTTEYGLSQYTLIVVLPLAVIIICTILILTALRARRAVSSSNEQMSKDEKDITNSLLCVAAMFLICQGYFLSAESYKDYILNATGFVSCPHVGYFLVKVAQFLMVVNSSLNFFIYYFTTSSFKNKVKSLLGCKPKAKNIDEISAQTGVTTVEKPDV